MAALNPLELHSQKTGENSGVFERDSYHAAKFAVSHILCPIIPTLTDTPNKT